MRECLGKLEITEGLLMVVYKRRFEFALDSGKQNIPALIKEAAPH